MILAWRGIVDEHGDVVAWPTVLMDHPSAFVALPMLSRYRARWRQWDNEPGAPIDFDPGASQEDREKVQAWVDRAQGVERCRGCRNQVGKPHMAACGYVRHGLVKAIHTRIEPV